LQADGSLKGFISAEKAKFEKQLELIQKRVQKANELKLEQELKQLNQLQEKLLPSGSLQERKESFLTFLINDPAFIKEVIRLVDPLDFQLHVFIYEQ
jgi:bacillithiol synthase